MQKRRMLGYLGSCLLMSCAATLLAPAAAAELSVVLGYETRNTGELEPCG